MKSGQGQLPMRSNCKGPQRAAVCSHSQAWDVAALPIAQRDLPLVRDQTYLLDLDLVRAAFRAAARLDALPLRLKLAFVCFASAVRVVLDLLSRRSAFRDEAARLRDLRPVFDSVRS